MRRKLALALCSLLCMSALFATGSFAWLSKTQSPPQKVYATLSDFSVAGTLYFGNTLYQSNENGEVMVPIGLTPGSENYIGDLRYEITYTGVSPAYLRVRVIEQWVDRNTGDIKSVPYMAYTGPAQGKVETVPVVGQDLPVAGSSTGALAEMGTWIDHRATDYAYYYSVPVQPRLLNATGAEGDLTPSAGAVKFTLIDQNGSSPVPTGVTPETTDLSLLIHVEAVQPNRFREFWNIDAIPQP